LLLLLLRQKVGMRVGLHADRGLGGGFMMTTSLDPHPGPLPGRERRRLACERCWKVKRSTFTNSTGWNDLVSYLSGGLLYGRDVAKPAWLTYERRRAYSARQRKVARKHEPKPDKHARHEVVACPILTGSAGVL